MNLAQFDSLSQEDKLRLIWGRGEFLFARDYYGKRFCFYSIENFFAEIVYEPNNNKIVNVITVRAQEKQVDKYLCLINIDQDHVWF